MSWFANSLPFRGDPGNCPIRIGPLGWEMLEIFAPFSPASYVLSLSQKLPHSKSHTFSHGEVSKAGEREKILHCIRRTINGYFVIQKMIIVYGKMMTTIKSWNAIWYSNLLCHSDNQQWIAWNSSNALALYEDETMEWVFKKCNLNNL